MMKERKLFYLWVLKFCLKIVYPNFNTHLFLVFLGIKYRYYMKKGYHRGKAMNYYSIESTSLYAHRFLIKEHNENHISAVLNKILIIPQNDYNELASQNLFYIDHGLLWVAVKPSYRYLNEHNRKSSVDKDKKNLKLNLNDLTSEIYKKLWSDHCCTEQKPRIMPILGSKDVKSNVALTTENEVFNIKSWFNFEHSDKHTELSIHPLLSLEYTPKVAIAAEVNLILNEYDLSNDFIKEVLSNYFKTPKLLNNKDVFSIDLTPEITANFHYKYLDLVQSVAKLFFKCNKLSSNSVLSNESSSEQNGKCDEYFGRPYFIVKGVTQLSLGENIHSLKPRDEYFCSQVENNKKEFMLLKSCPSGLIQIFTQIQECVEPFLNGKLNELLSSLSNPIMPILLITGPIGSGRHMLIKNLARYNGMNCLQVDCNALQSSTAKQTESKITTTIQKAKASSPVIVMMDNFEVFAVDAENNEDCRIIEYFICTLTTLYQNYSKNPIIIIAVSEQTELKPNILRIFLEKFNITKPNLNQRHDNLKWFTSAMQLKISVDQNITDQTSNANIGKTACNIFQRITAKTETFTFGDLDTLIHFALRESFLNQHSNLSGELSDIDVHAIQEKHFNTALESMRTLQSEHLDAPKIPKVYWEDIGGLEKLKKELIKTIQFPIKYPHLFKNSSLKRSGILLYGPPGCGKTLVAKAVSTELNVSFLSVKGPELLNMYIGQSEENVRKVFESAKASAPCIVFLDELDALAPRRGAAGDSGGASDRVVSQLLAEVDGVGELDHESSSFVFIMGATNRPDLLEQSLLRPGRLDKLIYVGPYGGLEDKTKVLKALCRSHNLASGIQLEEVAAMLPERCTGADLMQVVHSARSAAARSVILRLHNGELKDSELSSDSIVLRLSDFHEAIRSYKSSVTDEELAYYESLQQNL